MKTKYCKASGTGGRNQPKPLSGIETKNFGHEVETCCLAGINLNPYQGLKRSTLTSFFQGGLQAGINLNPYQGLKHLQQNVKRLDTAYSRNQPKPLSGIETRPRCRKFAETQAGINLNPYQGLKLAQSTIWYCPYGRNQPKPLSGIETTNQIT